MKDLLKEFTQLRAAIINRQAELQAELKAIDEALGTSVAATAPMSSAAPAASAPRASGKRGLRKRGPNSLSLAEAVLSVTEAKPLTKPEILTAVDKLGYVFAAKSPLNSLNTLLYTNKMIKNFGGKFGPK